MTNAIGKVIKIAIGLVIITTILSFLPIKIGLPDEIYNILTNSFVKDFFQLGSYFFPIKFAFQCFLVIFVARHFEIVINMVSWIYDIITK